ncbi:MAG: hypothetical protein AB2A00_32490 [Myxococcota bacterium]
MSMKLGIRNVLALAVLLLVGARDVRAAGVPTTLNVQGVLRQTGGGLESGTFNLTFRLYADQTGTNPVYEEVQTGVAVDGGVFSVQLGRVTSLDPLDFAAFGTMWLGVTVEGDPDGELPRFPLATTPYAFQAAHADKSVLADTATVATTALAANTLDGLDATAFQRALTVRGPLGLSNNELSLSVPGCLEGQVLKFDGAAWGCANDVDTNSGGTLTGITVASGSGLSSGGVSGAVGLTLTSCANGQVLKYGASGWACSDDVAGTGDVTGINVVGGGLTGGGLSGDISLGLVTCQTGEILKFGASGWACAADDLGVATGDVTSVDTAVGSGLQGGAAAGDVSLALQTCVDGEILKFGPAGWDCAPDDVGAPGTGDISAVIAGNGLTGGATGGDATLSVMPCADGEILRFDTVNGWACSTETDVTYTQGEGITITGVQIAVSFPAPSTEDGNLAVAARADHRHDALYYPRSDLYSRVESDARYALIGDAYTKTESDARYPLATDVYTQAQSDARYALIGDAYTQAESDARYALIGDAYTKAESDARYPLTTDVYTQAQVDAQFSQLRTDLLTADTAPNEGTDPVDWTRIQGIPASLLDGDQDTTYSHGDGLTLNAGIFAADFTAADPGNDNGAATTVARGDHKHDTLYYPRAQLYTQAESDARFALATDVYTAAEVDTLFSSLATADTQVNDPTDPVDWTRIKGIPPQFADGIDDGSAYLDGAGLTLSGNTFNVDFTAADPGNDNGALETVARGDHKHDALYYPRSDVYTKAEADARYPLTTDVYTQVQSDARYAQIGDAYTKAESDARYPLTTDVYTQVQSDARYAQIGDAYTKVESDARYPAIADVYAKTDLNTAGTFNDNANPVDWTRLKNVTAGTGLMLNSGTFHVDSAVVPLLGSADQSFTGINRFTATGTALIVSGTAEVGQVDTSKVTHATAIDISSTGGGVTVNATGALELNAVGANTITLSTNGTNRVTVGTTGTVSIPGTLVLGSAGSAAGTVTLAHSGNAFTTTLQPAAAGPSLTYTLPASAPTADAVLTSSDTAGTLAWAQRPRAATETVATGSVLHTLNATDLDDVPMDSLSTTIAPGTYLVFVNARVACTNNNNVSLNLYRNGTLETESERQQRVTAGNSFTISTQDIVTNASAGNETLEVRWNVAAASDQFCTAVERSLIVQRQQ